MARSPRSMLVLLPVFVLLVVVFTQIGGLEPPATTGLELPAEIPATKISSGHQPVESIQSNGSPSSMATSVPGIPPFFNIVFQPSSVNRIFSSYIDKAYSRFSEEVLSNEAKTNGDLNSYSVEAKTDEKSPSLLYPPMLPPYKYFADYMEEKGASSTCEALAIQDFKEFQQVVGRVDLYNYPKYNMPWFYHDPNPLCGRYFLRFLENWPIPSGSGVTVPSEFSYGKHGETDRTPLPAPGSLSNYPPPLGRNDGDVSFQQKYLHRLAILDTNLERSISKNGLLSLKATVAESFSGKIGVRGCNSDSDKDDVFISARLIGEDRIYNVDVTSGDSSVVEDKKAFRKFHFKAPDLPGKYHLEVKYVHINGSSNNPKVPRTLGIIGIRANDKGKSFKYNCFCDLQRHVYGSPIEIIVSKESESSSSNEVPVPPLCTVANHTHGMWVRIFKQSCQSDSNPYCKGDPAWLSDAAGFNTGMLWVPLASGNSDRSLIIAGKPEDLGGSSGNAINLQHPPPYFDDAANIARSHSANTATIPCRYLIHSPPGGPATTCLRIRDKGDQATRHGASLVFVGDSVMREYSKNCALFNLRGARLVCVFNNIVLEGQHYSRNYAKAVAENIVQSAVRNKAAIFGTNLGIHHMVGPCTTEQWVEFVDLFVDLWKAAALNLFYVASDSDLAAGKVALSALTNVSAAEFFIVEKAIWIGPPAIHYARKGMGFQRAALWDQIAWEKLEPLGFRRLNAIAPTASRQESTWDGLHYAAERGKVQTPLRDASSQVRQWNGGVSAMLFAMLLNIVCN